MGVRFYLKFLLRKHGFLRPLLKDPGTRVVSVTAHFPRVRVSVTQGKLKANEEIKLDQD